jgi:hypothetical protein
MVGLTVYVVLIVALLVTNKQRPVRVSVLTGGLTLLLAAGLWLVR